MLYNVGLLGYVKNDFIRENNTEERTKVQCFLSPGHSLSKRNLPKSESNIYLLHPCINDFIRELDDFSNTLVCKSFVIGDSILITQEQINNAIKEIEQHNSSNSNTTDDTNTENSEQKKSRLVQLKEVGTENNEKEIVKIN